MADTSLRLLVLGLLGGLVACSAATEGQTGSRAQPARAGTGSPPTAATTGASVASDTAGHNSPNSQVAGAAAVASMPAANSGGASGTGPISADEGCTSGALAHKEGCPCAAGETAACWTGPAADRNVGMCHDGLQVCTGNSEFASWGPCMGEQLSCGTDAGVPPPPDDDCTCIPGAVIQCSEDCSVGIICSLTATKTCLPDGTWSTCREDTGATLDLPGVQCRNMLHGCLDVLSPDGPSGQGELYVGDCSKQFKCGHAPTDPPPPPADTPEQPEQPY